VLCVAQALKASSAVSAIPASVVSFRVPCACHPVMCVPSCQLGHGHRRGWV